MHRTGLIGWLVAVCSVGVSVVAIAVVGLTAEFVRTLVATFMGAGLGFLVALYLDRIQRAASEEARRLQQAEVDRKQQLRDDDAERRAFLSRERTARDRRVHVLTLLREELGRVPEQMGRRQNRDEPPFDRLTDILWRTFSSSNELRWIDDPELLQKIASAYDLLSVEISLENRWTELRIVTTGRAHEADAVIANQLRRYDRDTWRFVCDACNAMDAALVAVGAEPGANAGKLFCP